MEEANRAFKESFFRKRLYVPKDLFPSVRAFHKELIGTVSEFTHDLVHARERGKLIDSGEWEAAMDRLNNEYSRILDDITEAFQKRMGF